MTSHDDIRWLRHLEEKARRERGGMANVLVSAAHLRRIRRALEQRDRLLADRRRPGVHALEGWRDE